MKNFTPKDIIEVGCFIFVSSLIMIFALIGSYKIYYDSKYKTVCVNETTVKEILELKYRNADILLSNGDIVTVNQTRLKVGDKWCLESKTVSRIE